MNKYLLQILLLSFTLMAFGQSRPQKSEDLQGFDRMAAWNIARQRFSDPVAQKEYMQFLTQKFLREKAAKSGIVNASQPYQYSYNQAFKTINVNLTPQNAYCPNMGFENLAFGGWTGDTWTLSGADWTAAPIWTPGIVTMGMNTPAQPISAGFATPTQNRHTILTIPPTLNNPPSNCIGWDSIAIDPATHLSDIPFVPPTGSGVTCRLGNANTGDETERIRYSMSVSAQNSQITLSYAVVLQNPGHPTNAQPFFQINLYDQNGNPISGCGNYQVDATLASSDPSFHASSVWSSGAWIDPSDPNWATIYGLYYKKWTMVGVDLTAYIGQNITVEFRTADCAYGGHFGYAYVDASCSPSQIQVNMCPGIPNQEAIGPAGYTSYQWYGPNNPGTLIPAPNGTDDTLTISNGNNGDIYYLTAVSANGCTTQLQATLHVSSVGISTTNSTPSCPGGNSGSASVVPTGSPGTYNFSWTNSSGVVGTTNPCNGLSPGTYSVHVSSGSCGFHDTTVTVGIAPPIMQTSTKNFCGSAAYLTTPSGATNIQWYTPGGAAVSAPQGTNDTLLATNAANGQVYAVTYVLSGCVDSMRITLAQVTGGTLSHTGIQNTCIGSSNGSAVVNLSTTQPSPYNFQMTGPGLNQTYNGTSQTSYTLNNLGQGSYTVTAFDGLCFYGDVFKIDTISIPVTLTVAPKTICNGDSAYINYSFGGAAPTQCQLSTSTCSNPQPLFVGPANNSNSSTSYPTPFGNYWTKMRAQYIYTAAELNSAGITAGRISSITFNCTQINGATVYPDFNINIGCTTQSTFNSFPSTTDLIPGLFNVYYNANQNVVLGANQFNFTSGYEWDGVSNLVVEVCFEFPGQVNYTNNSVVSCTSSSVYPSLTIYSDYDPMCAGLSSTAFYNTTASQMRPTAIFGWCSSVATPSMYTYNLSPNTGLVGSLSPATTTTLSPNATTSYSFTTTSVNGGCIKKDTFTISVIKPFNINMPPPALFCTNTPASTVSATFSDIITGAQLQEAATWAGSGISNNTGLGSAQFDPSAAGPGTYTLVLTAGSSCTLKDSVVYTVNLFQPALLNPIGPFCVTDPMVQVQAASTGGTWYGPVSSTGLFNPSVAGPSSNLTPPYHFIKYVTNGGTPCADSSTIQVQVFAKPMVYFSTDTTEGCQPSVGINFIPAVSPPGGTYAWVFGNGATSTSANPQTIYTIPGTYSPKLTYVDPNGCKDDTTATGLIIVHPKPVASFFANPGNTTILEPHINFINTSTGSNNTWLWDVAGLQTSTTKNTDYEFSAPGTYTVWLWVTNAFGCKDSAMSYVKIDPDEMIYVPNGFTPNYDGKNDVFKAEGFGIYEIEGFRMSIYDRWGNKMFEAKNINEGWDGTLHGQVLQQDTYVWEIEFKDISNKKHVKTGSVNLIR